MVTSVSDYHAPILPLKKPYFTGSQGIERVNQVNEPLRMLCHGFIPYVMVLNGNDHLWAAQ